MTQPRERKPIGEWNGEPVRLGESRDVFLAVSESYSGVPLQIPIHIRRAPQEGPIVFVTAALHGDEINGTGAIRQLIQDEEPHYLLRGAVLFVPVLNLPAFDHSLYVGALLAQLGEFSFVLAAVGRQSGIIEDFGFQLTIGLIAVTLLLSPLVVSLSRSFLMEARLPQVGAEA